MSIESAAAWAEWNTWLRLPSHIDTWVRDQPDRSALLRQAVQNVRQQNQQQLSSAAGDTRFKVAGEEPLADRPVCVRLPADLDAWLRQQPDRSALMRQAVQQVRLLHEQRTAAEPNP